MDVAYKRMRARALYNRKKALCSKGTNSCSKVEYISNHIDEVLLYYKINVMQTFVIALSSTYVYVT